MNKEASIKNLKNQVEQLANLLSERTKGFLPSNTKKNSRKEVNAINLRCGRELEKPIKKLRKDVVKETIESFKVNEFASSEVVPKVKVAPKVKVYKLNVPFLTKLVQHKLDK